MNGWGRQAGSNCLLCDWRGGRPENFAAQNVSAEFTHRFPPLLMKLKFLLPAVVLVLGFSAASRAQDNNPPAVSQPAQPAGESYTDEQVAEQLGWLLGRQSGLEELGFTEAEVEAVVKGLRAAAAGKNSPFDFQAVQPAFQAFMQRKQGAYMDKLRDQGVAFMEELKNKSGVVVLPSGLAYEIEEQGTGPAPKPEDTVRVHYTGRLVNGTVFDSSLERGEPTDIRLDEVIAGWTEGLQKISKGGKIKLYIPPQLGYGENGNRGIPPSATLVFDVELLDINPADANTGEAQPPVPAQE